MFGFVKNWLHKPEGEHKAARPAASSSSVGGGTNQPAATRSGSAPASGAEAVVRLPFAGIFSRLPKDLQSRVKLPVSGQAEVAVPLEMILPQLPRGAVRMTFGELRGLAGDFFYSQTDRDAAVVELPLGDILSRLHASQLPRRTQTAVAVPSEITSPFGEKGQGLHFYKPEAPAPSAPARKRDEPDAAPEESAPIAMTPTVRPATAPVVNEPAQKPIPMPAPPAPATATAARAPEKSVPPLTVPLTELMVNWPPMVRMEVMQHGLSHVTVALPFSIVEEALRKGRAVFAWKQIRTWVNSPAGATASTHDAELVELPLRVIAPLFLARQRPTAGRARVTVDEQIPNLFAAGATPKSAPVVPEAEISAPVPPPPAAKPEPIVFNDTEIIGKARTTENVRSGTEFLKRHATPNDIVVKAAALAGVAGALVTLADGLLVASQLPAEVDGDSLAAFTPQLYARVSQSAREYRMGELRDLSFTVGNTAWKIFKVGSIFLAVFGKPDQTLPGKELTALAAELDRKPKN